MPPEDEKNGQEYLARYALLALALQEAMAEAGQADPSSLTALSPEDLEFVLARKEALLQRCRGRGGDVGRPGTTK